MHKIITDIIDGSMAAKQQVRDRLIPDIEAAATILIEALRQDRKLLVCGNGGSAADSQHFVGEMICRLEGEQRRAFPALALTVDSSNLTAVGNDFGYDRVFARQVEALGRPGDVLIAITTSGNSPNILAAIEQAKSQQLKVIGLLGGDGGQAKALCHQAIIVPATHTGRIQECHILIIHILSKLIVEALR